MGCFSYLCKKCGKPINSDSFSGQQASLFLLKDGKVVEEMHGQYDSYGRVFNNNMDSKEWEWGEWRDVCNLHFSDDVSNGTAAYHTRCYNGVHPLERSENDPNQGWGRYYEPKKNKFKHKLYK